MFFIKKDIATGAVKKTVLSFWTMFRILPPILIIMNCLDVLIPRELVIKHMGKDAGLRGFFWAFVLGTFAAGPIYAAFPIAAMLAKKEARLAYLIFFLGMWTVTKLPIVSYELSYLGLSYTGLHVLTGIIFYYFLSLVMEKFLLRHDSEDIYEKLSGL